MDIHPAYNRSLKAHLQHLASHISLYAPILCYNHHLCRDITQELPPAINSQTIDIPDIPDYRTLGSIVEELLFIFYARTITSPLLSDRVRYFRNEVASSYEIMIAKRVPVSPMIMSPLERICPSNVPSTRSNLKFNILG